MDSSDSPLVRHLPYSWWPAWQLGHFFYPHTCTCTSISGGSSPISSVSLLYSMWQDTNDSAMLTRHPPPPRHKICVVPINTGWCCYENIELCCKSSCLEMINVFVWKLIFKIKVQFSMYSVGNKPRRKAHLVQNDMCLIDTVYCIITAAH